MSRVAGIAALLAAGLSGPAEPAGMTPKGMWDLFMRVCPPIVAAPSAARGPDVLGGGALDMSTTSDGWMTVGTISFDELSGGGIAFVVATFGHEVYPTGRFGHCMVQAVLDGDGGGLDGIAEMAAAEAPGALGSGAEAYGGPMYGGGGPGARAYGFRKPGFPSPQSIRLQIYDRAVMLSMTRFQPAEGN